MEHDLDKKKQLFTERPTGTCRDISRDVYEKVPSLNVSEVRRQSGQTDNMTVEGRRIDNSPKSTTHRNEQCDKAG